MRRFIFIVIFIVYAALNGYILLRGGRALSGLPELHTVYTVLFPVLSLSFIGAFLLEGRVPWLVTAVLENIGGFWLVALPFLLIATVLGDLLSLTGRITGISDRSTMISMAQLRFLYFCAVLLTVSVFSLIGYLRFRIPRKVTLDLNIPKREGKAGRMTVVAVSDVHLGDLIRRPRLDRYVDLINREDPDVVFIVGDLFDRNLHSVVHQHMEETLKLLKSRYGIYAVVGNHEYIGDVERSAEIIARSGITLLRDDAVTVDGRVRIAGRDDYTNKNRKALDSILAGMKEHDLPLIVLDHQPVSIKESVEAGADLHLSGHTHNGQIFLFRYIVSRIFKHAYGYRKTGKTHVYVSSGLGLWGAPIRLGSRSEYVRLDLDFTDN